MISEAELRRLAAQSRVDPMLQDLDYALGWFVAGLFSQTYVASSSVFKGGTCLRKCYFPDYRFSEDVDLTLTSYWNETTVLAAVQTVAAWSVTNGGPDFASAPPLIETLNDDYGKESLQVRVYFRAALVWTGSPRAIRLDLSRGEYLAFPTKMRNLHHPYTDTGRLGALQIPCYSLEEVLSEKIRAISGQRRFAISRDIYDIYQLVRRGASVEAVVPALPGKFATKGLDTQLLNGESLEQKRSVFATDWHRRLAYLLPPGQPVTFDEAWQATMQTVTTMQRLLAEKQSSGIKDVS